MFDLEKSIADWRQQMLAAGIKTPVPLEELECHLREDIEEQARAGTDEARAFELAVQRLGQAVSLKKEFMKTSNFKSVLLRKLKTFLGIKEAALPAMDNFEPAAKQTLELAPEEARQFRHNFIGTEHLLLGLMRSDSKTVSNVMRALDVNREAVRQEIERFVGTGPETNPSASIPYTPRAQQALQLAVAEAKKLNERQVKAEHIFLGLLREGGGVAAVVLKNMHVQLDRARAEVVKEMKAPPQTN